MTSDNKRDAAWLISSLILLFLMALFNRLHFFARETVGWDESAFILLGQSVLRGVPPYVEAFDNKPPGMFYSVAGWMALFGQSVPAVRWGALVSVWLIGVMVRQVAVTRLGPLTALALGAATILAFNAGRYYNAEVAAMLPLTGAVALYLGQRVGYRTSFVAGFLVSCAVLCRTNLAYVAVALGVLHLVAIFAPERMRFAKWSVVPYVLGGLVPVAAIAIHYAVEGSLRLLWVGSVEVALSYAGESSITRTTLMFLEAVVQGLGRNPALTALYAAVVIGFVATMASRRAREAWAGDRGRDGLILGAVLAATVVGMCTGGRFYGHYLMQWIPLMAILAAILIPPTGRIQSGVTVLLALGCAPALVLDTPRSIGTLADYSHVTDDYPMQKAAAAVRGVRREGETLWAPNNVLVHFYLNERPLVPIAAFPGNLRSQSIIGPLVAGGYSSADPVAEMVAKRPGLIVDDLTRSSGISRKPEIMADYAPVVETDEYAIYRRTSP